MTTGRVRSASVKEAQSRLEKINSPFNTAHLDLEMGKMYAEKGDKAEAKKCEETLVQIVNDEGVKLIGFRDVPTDNTTIGEIAREAEPLIRQILLGADLPQDELERKLYIIRKRAEKSLRTFA